MAGSGLSSVIMLGIPLSPWALPNEGPRAEAKLQD